MEYLVALKQTIPAVLDLAVPSLSLSLLFTSIVALFLYWSNSLMKKKLEKKSDKIKTLKNKLKSFSTLLKKKDREIGQLILAHETYDPLSSSGESENGAYIPVSSHIPKINEIKRHITISVTQPEGTKCDVLASCPQKPVSFSSLQKISGDTIFEEEVHLSEYQQGRIDEFRGLLNLSEDWKVMKSFTK